MSRKPSARTVLLATSVGIGLAFALGSAPAPADAKVIRIVIEMKTSPAFDGARGCRSPAPEIIISLQERPATI